MTTKTRIGDLIADIEQVRSRRQDQPAWMQLTYADQSNDPSISETGVTIQEWELESEGVVTNGTPE